MRSRTTTTRSAPIGMSVAAGCSGWPSHVPLRKSRIGRIGRKRADTQRWLKSPNGFAQPSLRAMSRDRKRDKATPPWPESTLPCPRRFGVRGQARDRGMSSGKPRRAAARRPLLPSGPMTVIEVLRRVVADPFPRTWRDRFALVVAIVAFGLGTHAFMNLEPDAGVDLAV